MQFLVIQFQLSVPMNVFLRINYTYLMFLSLSFLNMYTRKKRNTIFCLYYHQVLPPTTTTTPPPTNYYNIINIIIIIIFK